MRQGPKPKKSEAKAKPPVARKSPKDDASRIRGLEKRLAETLRDKAEAQEQQKATAEILRVISSSPTDPQPVFDTIVTSARALTGAQACGVFLLQGDIVGIAAHDSWTDEWRQE